MSILNELAELGQSIWLDYIQRSFLDTQLPELIRLGLRGMTSNPTIFEKAIVHSSDYEADLERLSTEGASPEAIFDALAVADIQRAADLFRPVYDSTGGMDGYVSIEVNPLLAHDTTTTLSEARRLWSVVDRPNIMIKIPGTRPGLPAIRDAIAGGINVNVTLIFSLERYADVMAAYIAGLEHRRQAGQSLDRIHSVASFFVSRVDTKVDGRLNAIQKEVEDQRSRMAKSLMGKAAVANAKIAYQQFEAVFGGQGFTELRQAGANLQRPLWASTSTKNPAYSDILYVQELIGPFTVNTLPQETLEAFVEHGQVRRTIDQDIDEARIVLQSLEDLGISMQQVTQELEDEGVASFSKSFESLMNTIRAKRDQIRAS